jgi:HSP20 family molecular chaperone IbpA
MSIVQRTEHTRTPEIQESARPWWLPTSTDSWLGFSQQDEADSVTYRLQAPGYRRRDLSIQVRDRVLIVRGEHADGWLKPRSKRAFIHSFKLPEALDERDVHAAFDAGVLRLTIRKKPHARRRQIVIRTPGGSRRPEREPSPDGDGSEMWSRILSWFRNHLPRRTGAVSVPVDAA